MSLLVFNPSLCCLLPFPLGLCSNFSLTGPHNKMIYADLNIF